MAHRLRQILRQLHSSVDALSDAQLLAQFINARDEAAFAALVRRHGRMVLGVSRRILSHTQDAEDVFQATFLVLARKAHAVVRRETVGTWLYRVAYRTALDARAMRERRHAKEIQVEYVPQQASPGVEVHDWRPILDEELARLPQKYQAPLVLCDLESRPRKEAAGQLGIPEGTLSSRLAKARKMLGLRLARRGVTLGAGVLAAMVAQEAVSGPLAAETARVATLVMTGELASVSGPVAVLVKGALKTMLLARFKMVGVLLVVACLALGAGSVAYHPVEAQNPAPAGKPLNEVEALRRENALLRLNVEVLLEKLRTQAGELEAVKQNAKAAQTKALNRDDATTAGMLLARQQKLAAPAPDIMAAPTPDVDNLLRSLREAKTNNARDRAIDALEKAVRQLREDVNAAKKPASDARPK